MGPHRKKTAAIEFDVAPDLNIPQVIPGALRTEALQQWGLHFTSSGRMNLRNAFFGWLLSGFHQQENPEKTWIFRLATWKGI